MHRRARIRAPAFSTCGLLLFLVLFPVAFLSQCHRAADALSTTIRAPGGHAASGVAAETSVIPLTAPTPTPDGTLLVSTLDGMLHALDLRSGAYLWSFGAGASLLHSSFEKEAKATKAILEPDELVDDRDVVEEDEIAAVLDQHERLQADLNRDLASHDMLFDQDEEEHTAHARAEEMKRRERGAAARGGGSARMSNNGSSSPLMIPGVDGSLFYSGTHGLQRLPINVAELVEAAPFKTGDNTRYLGFKETNVFLIHRNTGELKRVFSPMHTHAFSLYEECEDDECDPNLIWVAKTDLTVHAIDGRSGKLRWNVSISTYAPFDNTESVAELSEAELTKLGCPEIGVSVSGTVHAISIAEQRILWSQALHSPVTSVFLVRPEHAADGATGRDDADDNINIHLNNPGDMIKLPHFYFDVDADSMPSGGDGGKKTPMAAMVDHYHRSRDLSDITTFTYIGQTKNGLIYALPNPQPTTGSKPFFVDKPLNRLASSQPNANPRPGHSLSLPTKATAGAPTIAAIGTKPHAAVQDLSHDDDARCVPTSSSYPSCLIGFHALSVGSGSSGAVSNQQLLLDKSNEFYNQSVRPTHHRRPAEDDDSLVDSSHHDDDIRDRAILLPPPPKPAYVVPATDWHFWWPVLVISVILSVVVSATMFALQRLGSRRKGGNANGGKNKNNGGKGNKGNVNNNSNNAKKAPMVQPTEGEDDALYDDEKDDGNNATTVTAGMRKRHKKELLRGAFQRQTSEPVSLSASPPALAISPNASGSLVVRKSHFPTYESDSPLIPGSSSNSVSTGHSGDTIAIRPRKHIQSRPDTRQMNEDAAASTKAFSTPHTNSDGSVSIGSMVLYPHKVLGTGSMGTVVYAGTFGGRPCAIKRLVKPFFGSANAAQEIALLIQSDQHPNVLRYFAKDEDTSFIYLALEQCVGTIQDLVDDGREESLEHTKSILLGMMTGLAHLHSLHIVHRDIKPGNILLQARGIPKAGVASISTTCKVSDMGLGKQLDLSRSSFDSVVSGSAGWQAPEVLNADGGRLTKAVDVFSAGCVMHFVLTKGRHPFGDNVVREMNIAQHRMDLSALADQPEARDLIGCCLHPDPSLRMSAEDVCAHPFFWSPAKQLSFLLEASDRFESEPEHSELRMCLESQAAAVVGENWHLHLNQSLLDNLNKYRKYNTSSVRDCLRVIRNKKNHYRDLPLEVREELGAIPEGFLAYFTTRFPALLIYIYSVLSCFCLTSPASTDRSDQYSYSPLDLDAAHSHAMYDADVRQESLAFYHKPLRDYPELKFSSPQWQQFYEMISLRRLVQLQKHTRLRFRHWNVQEERWINAGSTDSSSTAKARKNSEERSDVTPSASPPTTDETKEA